MTKKNDSESTVREDHGKTGKKCSAEETVRIVLEGLRDEGSIRKGSKKAVISLGGTAKDWSVASRSRTGAKKTTPEHKRCHSLNIRIK
jgi:hypothetical protein